MRVFEPKTGVDWASVADFWYSFVEFALTGGVVVALAVLFALWMVGKPPNGIN